MISQIFRLGGWRKPSSKGKAITPARLELPTGVLTFLMTDIEGSSRLWEQYPQQMCEVMARHDALIEASVTQFRGTIVRPRGEGDSRFVVFPFATDAAAASIAIQSSFIVERWTIPTPLKVRIALHTGEADLREGDYYGTPVNRCARMRNIAHGGQTLISLATYSLLQVESLDGLNVIDLGEHKLKDLQQPERIYQLVAAGLPDDFPPLRTQDGFQNNLPAVLTSFVGRGYEISEITRLISEERLLTILGAGGSGKTRLSLQVASELLGFYTHGIWFCDLAPLSNPALVTQNLLNILSLREEEGRPLLQTLINYLRDKELLLILDNCEHLLPAVSQLAEAILLGAPKVKILATSREALGVVGEAAWWIPGLTFPDPNDPLELNTILQYEAVELFLTRATGVKTDFALSEQNIQTIAQICAHLDGIPLAIELAVARLRALTEKEIATRLGDRFQLLVGNRTKIMRQQTLQALIDWSHDLLSDNERILFRRISVFAGGSTLQAVEEVCSGGSVKMADVLDLLSRLIDKSLVLAESHGDCKRYLFLETIHQYSQQRLKEVGKTGKYARKHADYFLKMAEVSYGELWGPRQSYWLPRLEADHDNLRKALEWMARRNSRKEMLLRMSGSLWRFWSIRGYFTEGRTWLASALEKNPDAPPEMLANALRGAGILASQQGDYARAKELHERSLALFRQTGDALGTARELTALGEIAQVQGRYTPSLEYFEASLALMQEIGDKEGVAVAMGHLGNLAGDHGRYQQARELLEESLKLSRELEDKQLTALALKNLGITHFCLCEYQLAMDLFEEAVSLYRELKDDIGISNVLQHMGYVAKDLGDFKGAESLFRECLELKSKLGDRLGIAYAFAKLAEISFYQGKYPTVMQLTGRSIELFQELDAKRGVLFSKGLKGFAAHFLGDYETALSLAHECLRFSAEIEAPRPTAYSKELMGLVAYASGDLNEARTLFLQAVSDFEKVGDRRNMAMTSINLARTAYRQGDHECAIHFLNESLSLARELRIRWTVGFALEIMGLLERSLGHYERALELFVESLQISIEQNNQQGIANCLGAIAGVAAMTNRPGQAASLFAAAQKAREAIGARMGGEDQLEYDHYLALARQQMEDVEFQFAWSRGSTTVPEQIMAELCDWLEDLNINVTDQAGWQWPIFDESTLV